MLYLQPVQILSLHCEILTRYNRLLDANRTVLQSYNNNWCVCKNLISVKDNRSRIYTDSSHYLLLFSTVILQLQDCLANLLVANFVQGCRRINFLIEGVSAKPCWVTILSGFLFSAKAPEILHATFNWIEKHHPVFFRWFALRFRDITYANNPPWSIVERKTKETFCFAKGLSHYNTIISHRCFVSSRG